MSDVMCDEILVHTVGYSDDTVEELAEGLDQQQDPTGRRTDGRTT